MSSAPQNSGLSCLGVQVFNGPIPQHMMQRPVYPQDGPYYRDNTMLDGSFKNSEFNASTFNLALTSNLNSPNNISRAQSMMDLRFFTNSIENPRKAMSVLDGRSTDMTESKLFTQSLDRRILKSSFDRSKSASDLEFFTAGDGRIRNAYFSPDFSLNSRRILPQMVQNPQEFYYGRNINSFYPGKQKTRSKSSLGAESDDFQKYRDVAL